MDIIRVHPTVADLTKDFLTSIPCPVVGCGRVLAQPSALRYHIVKIHRIIKNDIDREILYPSKAVLKEKKEYKYFCPAVGCQYYRQLTNGDKGPVNEELKETDGTENTEVKKKSRKVSKERFKSSSKHFTTYKALRLHYMKVHAEKKYLCQLCNQSFAIPGDLNRHQSTRCPWERTCMTCHVVMATVESLKCHCLSLSHQMPGNVLSNSTESINVSTDACSLITTNPITSLFQSTNANQSTSNESGVTATSPMSHNSVAKESAGFREMEVESGHTSFVSSSLYKTGTERDESMNISQNSNDSDDLITLLQDDIRDQQNIDSCKDDANHNLVVNSVDISQWNCSSTTVATMLQCKPQISSIVRPTPLPRLLPKPLFQQNFYVVGNSADQANYWTDKAGMRLRKIQPKPRNQYNTEDNRKISSVQSRIQNSFPTPVSTVLDSFHNEVNYVRLDVEDNNDQNKLLNNLELLGYVCLQPSSDSTVQCRPEVQYNMGLTSVSSSDHDSRDVMQSECDENIRLASEDSVGDRADSAYLYVSHRRSRKRQSAETQAGLSHVSGKKLKAAETQTNIAQCNKNLRRRCSIETQTNRLLERRACEKSSTVETQTNVFVSPFRFKKKQSSQTQTNSSLSCVADTRKKTTVQTQTNSMIAEGLLLKNQPTICETSVSERRKCSTETQTLRSTKKVDVEKSDVGVGGGSVQWFIPQAAGGGVGIQSFDLVDGSKGINATSSYVSFINSQAVDINSARNYTYTTNQSNSVIMTILQTVSPGNGCMLSIDSNTTQASEEADNLSDDSSIHSDDLSNINAMFQTAMQGVSSMLPLEGIGPSTTINSNSSVTHSSVLAVAPSSSGCQPVFYLSSNSLPQTAVTAVYYQKPTCILDRQDMQGVSSMLPVEGIVPSTTINSNSSVTHSSVLAVAPCSSGYQPVVYLSSNFLPRTAVTPVCYQKPVLDRQKLLDSAIWDRNMPFGQRISRRFFGRRKVGSKKLSTAPVTDETTKKDQVLISNEGSVDGCSHVTPVSKRLAKCGSKNDKSVTPSVDNVLTSTQAESEEVFLNTISTQVSDDKCDTMQTGYNSEDISSWNKYENVSDNSSETQVIWLSDYEMARIQSMNLADDINRSSQTTSCEANVAAETQTMWLADYMAAGTQTMNLSDTLSADNQTILLANNVATGTQTAPLWDYEADDRDDFIDEFLTSATASQTISDWSIDMCEDEWTSPIGQSQDDLDRFLTHMETQTSSDDLLLGFGPTMDTETQTNLPLSPALDWFMHDCLEEGREVLPLVDYSDIETQTNSM